jgi:mannose-6-phosphate isomerase-like protein (cupin superfamily)
MKTKQLFPILSILLFWWSAGSCCNQNTQNSPVKEDVNVVLKDYGAEPTVLDIDAYTLSNDNFRVALWTGTQLQVTLMSVPVGGEIGLEAHPDSDQFFRIEEGQAKVLIGDTEESLTFVTDASEDFAIFVPAGKWHNLINTGDKPLKIYSIYAPVEHPHGTVHKTIEEGAHHH